MNLYFAHTPVHTDTQTHTQFPDCCNLTGMRCVKTHLACMHITIRGLWCSLPCLEWERGGETQWQFSWWHCRGTSTFTTASVLLLTLILRHHQAQTLLAVFAPVSVRCDGYMTRSSVPCEFPFLTGKKTRCDVPSVSATDWISQLHNNLRF